MGIHVRAGYRVCVEEPIPELWNKVFAFAFASMRYLGLRLDTAKVGFHGQKGTVLFIDGGPNAPPTELTTCFQRVMKHFPRCVRDNALAMSTIFSGTRGIIAQETPTVCPRRIYAAIVHDFPWLIESQSRAAKASNHSVQYLFQCIHVEWQFSEARYMDPAEQPMTHPWSLQVQKTCCPITIERLHFIEEVHPKVPEDFMAMPAGVLQTCSCPACRLFNSNIGSTVTNMVSDR